MATYSVISLKGGVSKSSTTVQLAVWIFNQGFSVAVVDNDPQTSVSDWLSNHPSDIKVIKTKSHQEMETAVYELQEQFDFVLIDNSAGDVLSMNITMAICDHILIPVLPSVVDINATLDTITELKLVRKRTKSKIPCTLFLNQITKGSNIAGKVEELLNDIEDVSLSPVQIPHTVKVRELSGNSASIFDDKKNKNIADLYDQLFDSTLT